MASHFDESDFVDADLQAGKGAQASSEPAAVASRPPSREELDGKVNEAQQRLAQLRQAQEELERERVALEETRRRRVEFQTGREEMVQNLTRGLGLLEEAEFEKRRDAEQMAKSIGELKDALEKVQGVREELWTHENLSTELTRALTVVENARMEWNSARLKWPLLSEDQGGESQDEEALQRVDHLAQLPFGQLCRFGFAVTWPIAAVILAGFAAIVFVLLMPN